MFQLALHRDRIEAIPHGVGASHHPELAFSAKEFFEDRRNGEDACPGFSKTTQQGEVFELPDHKRPDLLCVKPLIQRKTNVC